MLKKCFYINCTQQVASYCSCKGSPVYCCNMHLGNHCSTGGSHLIVSELEEMSQNSELLAKAKKILLHLKKTKKDIAIHTEKLVAYVNETCKKSLQSIRETENLYEKLFVDIFTGNRISSEDYEKISRLSIGKAGSWFNNYLQTTEILSQFYNINPFEEANECDEIVFSKDHKVGELCSIDLETLQQSKLNYAKIGERGGACLIKKGVYFFYGGFKLGYVGEVYVVNTIEKTAKALKSSIVRCNSASVFKNEKIYVFGGWISKNSCIKSSQTYDFTLNKWTDIHNLPSNCGDTTAAVVNNEIIISGYQFDKVYQYNDLSYSSILNIKSDEHIVVCDEWIGTPSILFENKNSTWKAHTISVKLIGLCVYTTFKRGQYIYFIDWDYILWRVNTESKEVKQVNYSG